MSYKYLKYKIKYLTLKNQLGGVPCSKCGHEFCTCDLKCKYVDNKSMRCPMDCPDGGKIDLYKS
jgi:hypothetical protein